MPLAVSRFPWTGSHPLTRLDRILQSLRSKLFLAALSLTLASVCVAQTVQTVPDSAGTTGPIRLRQAVPTQAPQPQASPTLPAAEGRPTPPKPLYQPGEFEQFVQRLAGNNSVIRRLGSDLRVPTDGPDDAGPLVPPEYVLKPGDEVLITIWGSVDADLRTRVDRSGRISIPRVGPVLIAGVRYADLNQVIAQRVGQVFRNFQVSSALGQLRAQRIYVTGFVDAPGALNVSSLATVVHALIQAGGPSPAGSMRDVRLVRNGQRTNAIDLYDFLVNGNREGDVPLQPEDVIYVGPVGPQVALVGSVNRPAVFELRPDETVADALRMAGGFTAVADRTRLALERLDDRATVRITELALPARNAEPLRQGDVLRAFSAVEASLPIQRQNKRVRIEGEVSRPGEYVLPPESTIGDALGAAGGLTQSAFVFGTDFSRESVRLAQQNNYDRALRDLETDLARSGNTQRIGSGADEASALAARDAANARLLNALRSVRPTGRVVLQLEPGSTSLPPLALEDGDRLFVPPRPTTVGVFGSVFNGGSYLHGDGRMIEEYIALAGGPTRGADANSTFVIRANGSVISGLQSKGFWSRGTGFRATHAEPGDTVFVPEEMDKSTFTQNVKDWTQIIYQLGLGAAGFVAATK